MYITILLFLHQQDETHNYIFQALNQVYIHAIFHRMPILFSSRPVCIPSNELLRALFLPEVIFRMESWNHLVLYCNLQIFTWLSPTSSREVLILSSVQNSLFSSFILITNWDQGRSKMISRAGADALISALDFRVYKMVIEWKYVIILNQF